MFGEYDDGDLWMMYALTPSKFVDAFNEKIFTSPSSLISTTVLEDGETNNIWIYGEKIDLLIEQNSDHLDGEGYVYFFNSEDSMKIAMVVMIITDKESYAYDQDFMKIVKSVSKVPDEE